MGAWDLILDGKFEEACALVDQEMRDGRLFNRRNKVIALLKMGRAKEAQALCEENCKTATHTNEFDFVFLGTSQWIQGLKKDAVSSWLRATKAQYVDIGGGIESRMLLLYAAERDGLSDLKEEALGLLKKLPATKAALKTPNSSPGWPLPLASYALGMLTCAEVRAGIASANSTERLRPLFDKHSCQAEFYFGALSNDPACREVHFKCAAENYVPNSFIMAEHHLAFFEISQNK